MDEFLFSENKRARRIRNRKRDRIFDDQAVEAVAQALHDTAPLPALFEDLIPYAGNPESLREILFALLTAGGVNLHVHDFPCQETVTEKPRASGLARYQAAAGSSVTNACHIPVELDPIACHLVRLLDGTRRSRASWRRWRERRTWKRSVAICPTASSGWRGWRCWKGERATIPDLQSRPDS